MSDLPKMSTWGTQGQKYEICDQAARERNTQLGKETENIRNEVEALKQMSATAEELPSGSAPTASYSNGVFHIGIPQGPQGIAGEAGITPNITVTASTGEPGTDVRVTQSGTVENPVLAFTIPRGNDGHAGANGVPGKDGQGVPTGGTAGQVLRKTGSGDYEAEWSDKAGDSERLGGLDAQYYMQGRAAHNLLDNSNFADLVAQAGLNGAHGSTAYIADRWKSASATATQQSGYTTLSTAEKTGRIAQQLPDVLAGKTVTAAAKVSGSSIVYCGVYYNQNSVSKSISISVSAPNGIMMKSGTIPSDATDIEFRVYIAYTDGGGSCDVYWAALYEGAYTAETLPAYVPKGYAVELAECQRYYKEIPEQTSCAFATSAQGGKYFSSSITFNPMRITPTVSFKTDSDGKIGVVQGVAFVSPSEFNFAYIKNGCLLPTTTNAAYAGLVMSFYGIQLSADL